MIPRVVRAVLGLALLPALSACGDGTEPDLGLDDECTLQFVLSPQTGTVAVGDSLAFFAHALPMLPPGHGCGSATVTWRLSEPARASLAITSAATAVLRATSPGVVTVIAHGAASGHEADDSATITITPH